MYGEGEERDREREIYRYFLRMIPALKQYPDIALDISSGFTYTYTHTHTYIYRGGLTLYRTSFLEYAVTFYPHYLSDIRFWQSALQSIWHIFWHPFWRSIWHIFWNSNWQSSGQSFWHSSWRLHSFWLSFWPSIGHPFLAFCLSTWHLYSWGPSCPIANCTCVINFCREFAHGQPWMDS